MWTTSKKQSRHTVESNRTFNNNLFGISYLDSQPHSTFLSILFPPSETTEESSCSHNETSDESRRTDDFTVSRLGRSKVEGFHNDGHHHYPSGNEVSSIPPNGKGRKIIDPNMPWEKHIIWWHVSCQEGDRPDSGKLVFIFSRLKLFLKVGFRWESDTVDQCHISCPFMPCMLLDHLCVLKAKDSSSSWRRWFYLWVIHSQFRTRLIWGHFGEG